MKFVNSRIVSPVFYLNNLIIYNGKTKKVEQVNMAERKTFRFPKNIERLTFSLKKSGPWIDMPWLESLDKLGYVAIHVFDQEETDKEKVEFRLIGEDGKRGFRNGNQTLDEFIGEWNTRRISCVPPNMQN